MIRILIVEDDWAAREGLKERLADEPDLEVVGTAQNAQEALEQLALWQPDVVILDYKLQGKFSGVEVAKEIRACGWPTRVLAHSAYVEAEKVQAMLEAGAVGYYVKGESTYIEMVTAIRTVDEGLPWFSISLREDALNRLRVIEEEEEEEEEEGKLTSRQTEILLLVEKGLSNKEIALALGRKKRTIDFHLERIFKRLGVHNRLLACQVAREKGWLKELR